MQIKFNLVDEKTITNTTVKLTTWIQGVVGKSDRPALEAASLALVKKLFPDAKWAFSSFSYMPDGFTFRVQATTRIDSTQNDQLVERALGISDKGSLSLTISDIDASVPLFMKREGESDLRVDLIAKAQEQAKKLGGRVSKVDFTTVSHGGDIFANNGRAMAASASYNATAKGVTDGVILGQSEKIILAATITVDVGTTGQLNG